jgi:hypothetical protein
MGRNYFRTGLKPGHQEDFWIFLGWSILVPACPGWDKKWVGYLLIQINYLMIR